MVVYAVFTFLYLVGSSLVASTLNFYNKLLYHNPKSSRTQLVICIVSFTSIYVKCEHYYTHTLKIKK